MEYTEEHTPQFPQYVVEGTFRDDVLAVSPEEGLIVTELGEEFFYSDFEELRAILFHDHYLDDDTRKGKASLVFFDDELFMSDIYRLCLPFTGEGAPAMKSTVRSNAGDVAILKGRMGVNSIKVYCERLRGPRSSSIVPATNFGCKDKSPQFILENMRQLYDYIGYGTASSQGALGMLIFRQCWLEQFGENWKLNKHRAVPNSVRMMLSKRQLTGLVETPGEGMTFKLGLEIDRKAAYTYAMKELPTGSVYQILRFPEHPKTVQWMEEHGFKWWIGEHHCIIKEPLAMGVFPVQEEAETKGRRINALREQIHIWQPTEPGEYLSYMGAHEARGAVRHGVEVEVGPAFAWKSTTTDCQYFIDKMQDYERNAPTEFIRHRVKGIRNALVGVLATPNYLDHIVAPHG